jgi:hypothetical protein
VLNIGRRKKHSLALGETTPAFVGDCVGTDWKG